jgi:hypothetical protein
MAIRDLKKKLNDLNYLGVSWFCKSLFHQVFLVLDLKQSMILELYDKGSDSDASGVHG